MNAADLLLHVLAMIHGIAAGLLSAAAFHGAGWLVLPARWQQRTGATPTLVIGAALYVSLCWLAIASRQIPLATVIAVLGCSLAVLALVRLRLLRLAARGLADRRLWRGVLGFAIFYALAYVVMWSPVGGAMLRLAPDGNVALVTWARYARHLLELGSPNVYLAPFDYTRSPATAHLLAWHSIFFGFDPLSAAVPMLLAGAAGFATAAAAAARRMFVLNERLAFAIACVAVVAPAFRWALGTYRVEAVLGASLVLCLFLVVLAAATRRSVSGDAAAGAVAACVLLGFVKPMSWQALARVASGAGELLADPPSILGWPGRLPGQASEDAGAALFLVLPIGAVALGLIARGLREAADRWPRTELDRRLARALGVYTMLAIIGANVAVDAVREAGAVRVTSAWRGIEAIAALPFRAMTVKMDEPRESVSTALALYFLSGKDVTVIGGDVDLEGMSFVSVSRLQPMFVHDFACHGVGHDDTVAVSEIGCLMLSPPGIRVGVPYRFNRTFLFLTYYGLGPRGAGGRWSTSRQAVLNVTADPERADVARDLYANLLVRPAGREGVEAEPLIVTWGSGHRAETAITDRAWISLPVTSADWRGNRLWTLPVAIDAPRRHAVLFEELIFTDAPRGRVLETHGTTE